MIGAVRRRLAGGMQGEAKIDQADEAIQWRLRRSKRCHSPAHGLTTRKKRQAIGLLMRGGDGTANTYSENRFAVRSFDTLFHIGKLIPQGRNTIVCQFFRDIFHENVTHSGASAV